MCKGKLLIGFPILLFVSILMGNSFVDNGPNPGELYIIGPDISPDSSEYTFLYYSPDSGKTLIVKDTLHNDWLGIASDRTDGILYAVFNNNTYRSENYGQNWEFISSLIGGIHSGVDEGEVVIGCGYWSTDYGSTFWVPSAHGWVPIHGGDSDVGVDRGCLFVLVNDGTLIATFDYGENYDTAFTLPNGGIIRSGAEGREMFAVIEGQVYYSYNACSTFVMTGYAPNTPGISYDYCCGWSSGEIFAVGRKYNTVPMEGIFGGEIEIWHSTDAGASWELLYHHSPARVIEEREEKMVGWSCRLGKIVSSGEVEVYDIGGRLIFRGTDPDMRLFPDGLYIVSDGIKTGKILWVK